MFNNFNKSITLEISDDSGFIAIINAEEYSSFVDENWELTQLFNHFVAEMNNENIIIWSTGSESKWTVLFNDKPSIKKSFREFTKTITVTSRQLCLTNYEDLTMAAQFETEKVPAKHNADFIIKLDNGKYAFTVRQMFDPEDYDYDPNGKTNFEIIIQPDIGIAKKIDKVFWWTN